MGVGTGGSGRRRRHRSHALDEPLDPLVDGPERVLAEHRALGLVVELEVDPVDGEVPPAFLRPAMVKRLLTFACL